ncbi:AAA family ATPase, partial [Streptomyces rochei]|nr:AAA family ATPase [Streptomyces rochei]
MFKEINLRNNSSLHKLFYSLGTIIGVKNPIDFCLNVENKINDSIQPHPDYNLEIDDKTNVVTLTVKQGDNPPYLYKAKAYK